MARKPPAAPKPSAPPPSPGAAGLTVTTDQLAQVLAIDPRSVRRVAQEGHLVKAGKDQYAFIPSITKYVTHLREQAAGRKSGDEKVDAVTESALLRRAQRRKHEIDAQHAAGELIAVADVIAVMEDHIAGVRQMVLAWPSMAQEKMPHLNNMDIETLKAVAHEVLKDNVGRVIEETKMHPELQEQVDRKRGVMVI